MIAAGYTQPDGLPVYVADARDFRGKHGTTQKYKRGCRCQPCRDAHAELRRKSRQAERDSVQSWQLSMSKRQLGMSGQR